MKIQELFESFSIIKCAIDNAGSEENEAIIPVICTAIDYCAAKLGMKSSDFIDFIKPMVSSCEEELGQIPLD